MSARKPAELAERTPPTWPEGTAPTIEQMADWLETCTRAERVEFIEKMEHVAQVAQHCFAANHEGKLRQIATIAQEA